MRTWDGGDSFLSFSILNVSELFYSKMLKKWTGRVNGVDAGQEGVPWLPGAPAQLLQGRGWFHGTPREVQCRDLNVTVITATEVRGS